MNVGDIWNAIEKDGLHGAAVGVIRRRILPQACCDLFLGIEKPSNRRIFILRVAAAGIPDLGLLPQARGFEVRISPLPDDPAGYSSVMLLQTNDTFRDIFTSLTSDIADHIAQAPDQRSAMQNLLARLRRWQQFLEHSGPDGLGDEAQRGLFGELWFIKHYLLPILGTEAINAWQGPFRASQDFQLGGVGIEVKTTTAREHQKLIISGEKQLEASAQFRIFLFHLSLAGQRDTGVTLVNMVAQVRDLLAANPLALATFEDGLLASGYIDHQAARYLHTGYLERENHFFEVRDEFPRIVGTDLREGVGDVAYSIGVAACLPYQLSETDFVRFLKNCQIESHGH